VHKRACSWHCEPEAIEVFREEELLPKHFNCFWFREEELLPKHFNCFWLEGVSELLRGTSVVWVLASTGVKHLEVYRGPVLI